MSQTDLALGDYLYINMKHFKNLPNVNVTGSSPSTSASWSGSDNVFSGEAFGASKVGLILFDSGDADGFLKNQDFNSQQVLELPYFRE